MQGRLRPEPSARVDPGSNFHYTWRNLSAYPPDCVADVEKVLSQCRLGLFHLERSIAFVSGEVTNGTNHSLDGLGSILGILAAGLNDQNYLKVHDAAVSIFAPLEPWAAAIITTSRERLQWSYVAAQSMCLLLEPLMPDILADVSPDKVQEVEHRFDAAQRHIAGLDEAETIRENIARKEARHEGLLRKALRWVKGKFTRKPMAANVCDVV